MSAGSAADTAISIQELSKRYGRLTAVKRLGLEVMRGEVFGFLGLNGAGKTTTIRILLDLLRPTGGRASVFGFDCQSQGLEARARIGYLPGEMGVYGDMTGRRLLDFLAKLKRRAVDEKYRRELQDRLALSDADLARRLREYSTGMKRKLGLIQAFQDDPELLILDEPTEGLDPLMQEAFYELLADVKAKGRTVFMSSHVLSEVERVCDRVGLLKRGELVLLSPVEEIRNLAARRVRVIFAEDVRRVPDLAAGHELLDTQPRVWTLRVNGPLGPLVSALSGLPVSDLMVEEPHLEDVILKYYREGD
ncbi:MAG TPA: ABC transporter ATP-binding protein [Blastocatellia bacterium]|nr:ABC transporter ATP-binding protein [Blastocatellia bacterium]